MPSRRARRCVLRGAVLVAAAVTAGPSAGGSPAPFPIDGRVLLVTESAVIQAVRPDGRDLVSVSGFRGLSPRLSPDGRWLVATRSGEVWLQPFGGDDSRARRVTKRGHDAIWSPNGQRLAFFRSRALRSIGVDSRQPRLLWVLSETMAPSPEAGAIDWSPDGRRIVLADKKGASGRSALQRRGSAGSAQPRFGASHRDGRRAARG